MNAYPRHIKKDYQAKNLQNPFFHKRKSLPKRSAWKWMVPAVVAILSALAWLVFAAPFWQISHIELDGFTRVPSEEVESIVREVAGEPHLLSIMKGNIFLFSPAEAEKRLTETYNLTDCHIDRRLPRTLLVTGYERPYAFIWQEGKECYYASGDGYVIKEQAVSDDDKQKYFLLENRNPGSLIGTDNKINVNKGYLDFIMDLDRQIRETSDLKVDRYIIDWEFNTLKVKFQNGPLVYFNTKDLAVAQLDRLLLVKKEKIMDNFSKTEYIDIRYGDKIFINPDFK